MSEIADIADAIAAQVVAAIPAYSHTRGESSPLDGFTPLEGVAESAYPFAMVFNPTATATRLGARQSANSTQFSVILLRKPGESATMRLDVETLKLAIERSNGFTNTVLDAYVTEWSVDETSDVLVAGGLVVESTTEVV